MKITQPIQLKLEFLEESDRSEEEPIGRALGLLLLKFKGPILEMEEESAPPPKIKPDVRDNHEHADDELISFARQAFYQIKDSDRPEL